MKTLNPHSRFFGLINRLPHADAQDLVWQYSKMLTESLSEFYAKRPDLYNIMIQDLQKMVNKMDKPGETPKIPDTNRDIKKLRSAVLHRLQKHGIDTTNWEKVNSFLEQPRIAGKRLYQMNLEEIENLIKKLESILKKDKTREKEINRLSKMN